MNRNNQVKYNIDFEMIILGCKLNFSITDNKLLELMSQDKIEIKKIRFSKDKNGSVLSGSFSTIEPIEGYNYILFGFKALIINILVTIYGIENLRIEDDVQFNIINKEELKAANQPIIPCGSRFMVISPEVPEVSKDNFEDRLRSVSLIQDKFYNTALWQYIAYSVTDLGKGKTIFDIISQYRLLWTAFNSLYGELCPERTERLSLEVYSGKSYVIEFFKSMMGCYSDYENLKRLVNGNLFLRYGKENVSLKLEESIKNQDYKSISKYCILCLYAIRNPIIHGTAEGEQNLCRVGFAILNPLIKESLKREMVSQSKSN